MTAETTTVIDRLLAGFFGPDRSGAAGTTFTEDTVAWTAGRPDARGTAAVGELLDAVAATASSWTVVAKIVGEHTAVVELVGLTTAGASEPVTAVVELAGAQVRELWLYRDPAAFGGT